MKNFESFVNSQPVKGKLFIEIDDGQYDENWKMTIDISKQWQDYVNNIISIIDFNNQYASLLMEQQQNISAIIGDSCWNEIEPIVADELRSATNVEESETIFNKLYDIFDQYEIKIDCGKTESEMVQNQTQK
ncbi:MAG: hypothetical protein HPY57_13910 [Ignavibacteria bacterium]|nr:hypothetical protein [Ignavibacteria bacterium]